MLMSAAKLLLDRKFTKRPLALYMSVLLLSAPMSHTVHAAPVGNLSALQQQAGVIQITTDAKAAVTVQLLKPDLLRIRAGLNGTLTDESWAAPGTVQTVTQRVPQLPHRPLRRSSSTGQHLDYQGLDSTGPTFALRF